MAFLTLILIVLLFVLTINVWRVYDILQVIAKATQERTIVRISTNEDGINLNVEGEHSNKTIQ